MSTNKVIAILILGLALIPIPQSTYAARDHKGGAWLGAGTVTRVDGSTFYLLSKDNLVYTIDAGRAELRVEFTADSPALRAGDLLRVYGKISGERKIQAVRVRIFKREAAKPSEPTDGTKKEIKIIIQREPAAPPDAGSGPQAEATPQPEQSQECVWEGRGLITDIDYTGRKVKLRTSSGQFTVNLGGAPLRNGSRLVSIGRLNLGDAIQVSGALVGVNEIDARQLVVQRTRSEAENALPQTPLSIVGVVQQVDVPSLTFTMWTETTPLVVVCDANTVIQEHQSKMTFRDLRPGTRIKMSGYGSLATGYVAQHIQIIGVSP